MTNGGTSKEEEGGGCVGGDVVPVVLWVEEGWRGGR